MNMTIEKAKEILDKMTYLSIDAYAEGYYYGYKKAVSDCSEAEPEEKEAGK